MMQRCLPDERLAAAQAGDPVALAELVRAHRQGVYRYGLRVCRTTEDAEDAVQTTLWIATRALRSFRGRASELTSWLFTIVRRECLRRLDGRSPLALGDELPTEGPGPEEALVARERARRLARALAELEPGHREVVLLRDIQELSAPEAADQLGISIGALESRLHRAREQLRAHVLGEPGAC
jgi:RNA polymerase sigma factor (sigma-70 family)